MTENLNPLEQYFFKTYDTVYGPYRKRYPTRLVVAVPAANPGLMSAALTGHNIRISVASESKVEVLSWRGWITVWGGSKAKIVTNAPQQQIEFEIPASDLIRVTSADGKSVGLAGLKEDHPSLLSSLLPTAMNLKASLKWFSNTLQSTALHVLFVVALLVSNHVSVLDLLHISSKLKDAQTNPEPVPIEMVQLQNQGSEFNGRSISPDFSNGQTAQLKMEQKNQRVIDKLTNLVGRLSAIKLPSSNGSMVVSAVDKDGGSHSLLARMEQGKDASVSGNLKALTSGKAGDNMRWQLYAKGGRELSLRDQEQVIELFKSLQPSFRACYESALLKEETLSVTVQYESEVTGDGRLGLPRYAVEGKSTPQSESALTGCITNVLSKEKVSKNLSGVKIRNQFIFRS